MINNRDLVSVIIPTYNRAFYLQQAIESVIKQNNENIELIVVNDGSTDHTENIINTYQNKIPKFKHIYQENKGPSTARNTGIKNSSGDYIIFLDDDDLLIFNGIDKLLNSLKNQDENVKLVCGNLIIDYAEKNSKRAGRLPVKVPKKELLLQFLICNPISVGQVIIDKKAIIEAGYLSPDFLYAEDYDLWTRIILKHDIAYINHPVLLHRKHNQQITNEKRGLVRYYSDKVAFKFLQKINIRELIQTQIKAVNITNEMISNALENLAKIMLNYPWTHFDTAIEILLIAQNEFYKKERQVFINRLAGEIPNILEKNFYSNLRLTAGEKKELKNLI